MVGELTGSAAVLRFSRDETDFHLKVSPQLKPPRTSGDGVYCARHGAGARRAQGCQQSDVAICQRERQAFLHTGACPDPKGQAGTAQRSMAGTSSRTANVVSSMRSMTGVTTVL